MRTWKNYLCMLAALVVTLGFTSCESDEDIGFDLSGLYGVTWFGDMGAGDSWGEPLDSYITAQFENLGELVKNTIFVA